MLEYSCRVADWQTESRPLCTIRRKVFIEEQAVPENLEWDAYDDVAVHFVVLYGDTPVGTGRLKPDGQLGRMAIMPMHRGSGAGGLLLQSIIDYYCSRGGERLYCHAQSRVTGFYERYGFHCEGEEFMDAGIPHRAMSRNCATTQA